MKRDSLALCMTLVCGVCHAAEHAHVHGVAALQIAVDGPVLTLSFESPLHNVLGFEHAPHTAREKAAVAALKARLEKADQLFVPAPAAKCSLASVKLDSPVFEARTGGAAGGDAHGDLDAEFGFRCERPDLLRSLEARLFDGFPNLKRLDVQIAAGSGTQAATRLTGSERVVRW